MKDYIQIKGVRGVKDWIGAEMSNVDERLLNIMKGTALVIMDAAKRTSPVITGRYRASIHIEFGGGGRFFNKKTASLNTDNKFKSSLKTKSGKDRKSNNAQYTDDKFSKSPRSGEIFVGTNVVYAGAVERKHQTIENATTSGQWYLTRKINELTRR